MLKCLLVLVILLAPVRWMDAADVDTALVSTSTWTESWPDAGGLPQPREVKGAIWNEAIQAALDKANTVHLPKRDQPYYLDGPIILKSGQKLTADAEAEIRLKPGTNTCMVRNENIIGFADQPVPEDTKPDTNITIEGGIWTTLANGVKDISVPEEFWAFFKTSTNAEARE